MFPTVADLGVEGAGVGLAHGQTGGPRHVSGGVGWAGPAGGLACCVDTVYNITKI